MFRRHFAVPIMLETAPILALETSGRRGSVALQLPHGGVDQIDIETDQSTAQMLVACMSTLLKGHGLAAGDVSTLGVTTGPGSFTGLRIGVTAAKTFAYVTGCRVIGVNTLEVLARQSNVTDARIWTLLDAQRGQVVAAAWRHRAGVWKRETAEQIWEPAAWFSALQDGDRATGGGLERLAELPDGLTRVPADLWEPRAETVARMAGEGREAIHDLASLVPHYHRRSAAQEKGARG